MATIASQIILHPVVSQGLKFGGTTLGRDKTYRALQYFSRFYAWYLINKGDKLEAARVYLPSIAAADNRGHSALRSDIGYLERNVALGDNNKPPVKYDHASFEAQVMD